MNIYTLFILVMSYIFKITKLIEKLLYKVLVEEIKASLRLLWSH